MLKVNGKSSGKMRDELCLTSFNAVVLNLFTPSTTSENICLSKYHHNVKRGGDSSVYHQRGAQVPPVVQVPQVENHWSRLLTKY